jgi:hypothetical protein
MIKELKLEIVRLLPHQLQPGILYVSIEHEVAGHLCPCGCNTKVFTRLGPAGWSFKEENGKATLNPSLGNWQLPCRSHYWIRENKIEWSEQWTDEEIEEGKNSDLDKKRRYFEELHMKRQNRTK